MAALEQTRRSCPECGTELQDNQLCPKCLLRAALSTEPQAVGPQGTVVLQEAKRNEGRGLPQPAEQLGHYRVVRLLGEGGMGAVFEADDLESGRRVALKVLSQALDSPAARERFLREGRLAASINHPNSVYVFGTEEIAGTPVIAMELVSGGTLQDRVNAQGPLPTMEAVDCVLQIIAGLEAAQRIGILHRDIKPSNCFVDAEGTVKIGDFGLSISTTVRTEPALTAVNTFLGTPAFCSPEQLRGDELSLRSDMYSVGATLFYLLTGRAPFEARNSVQMIATVLEQRAPNPRKFRPAISPGLAKAIQRCLEKQPGERFKSYRDLAKALAPYGSAAPTPATLGLRFAASAVDLLLLNALSSCIVLLGFGTLQDILELANEGYGPARALMLAGFGGVVLYYGLLESYWGATIGKAICRLRVVGRDNNPPSLLRSLARALFFVVLPLFPYLFIYGANPKAYLKSPSPVHYLTAFAFYLVLGLMFSTARRRNGFAAVHDLLTRTRVTSRAALLVRPGLAVLETPPPQVGQNAVLGPYHILENLGQTPVGQWVLGYDLRLLRKVWIRTVPAGTAPVPIAVRNIGRIGRLRWLTGRRSAEENWDAFEAPTGKPLLAMAGSRQPWSQVRFWLHDLASEINTAEKEGSLPLLALDRVWITADGRAKLLDFPPPGIPACAEAGEVSHSGKVLNAQLFLSEVVAQALGGASGKSSPNAPAQPLPLHARAFLKSMSQTLDAGAVAAAIKPLLQRVPEISRWRRAAVLFGCLAFPILACVGLIFGQRMLERWRRSNPGVMELHQLLSQRAAMNSRWAKGPKRPTDRQYAIYIAHHYAPLITNEASWSSTMALSLIKGEARRFAERSVAENPALTEAEITEALAAVGPKRPVSARADPGRQPWFPLMVLATALVIYVGLPALIAALLFRGGLVLLAVGITFVRRDGERASRLRAFWRALVAWSPVALGLVMAVVLKPQLGGFGAAICASLLVVALAIVSLALPTRGLADRLAGTWPVPR